LRGLEAHRRGLAQANANAPLAASSTRALMHSAAARTGFRVATIAVSSAALTAGQPLRAIGYLLNVVDLEQVAGLRIDDRHGAASNYVDADVNYRFNPFGSAAAPIASACQGVSLWSPEFPITASMTMRNITKGMTNPSMCALATFLRHRHTARAAATIVIGRRHPYYSADRSSCRVSSGREARLLVV
jgi:hypothetical protein